MGIILIITAVIPFILSIFAFILVTCYAISMQHYGLGTRIAGADLVLDSSGSMSDWEAAWDSAHSSAHFTAPQSPKVDSLNTEGIKSDDIVVESLKPDTSNTEETKSDDIDVKSLKNDITDTDWN